LKARSWQLLFFAVTNAAKETHEQHVAGAAARQQHAAAAAALLSSQQKKAIDTHSSAGASISTSALAKTRFEPRLKW